MIEEEENGQKRLPTEEIVLDRLGIVDRERKFGKKE